MHLNTFPTTIIYMNLKHDNLRNNEGEEGKREKRVSEEKKREFGFFKNALNRFRSTTGILAVAASAVVFAYSCGSPLKSVIGDVDTEDAREEISDSDADIPDMELDEITDPAEEDVSVEDVIEEDVAEEDVLEEDVSEEDAVEEDSPPLPTCFTIPTPIDPTTDSLLNDSSSQGATFNNTGPETITADLETNVSMTGYPITVLGVCPDDPDVIAFVANPGVVVPFAADVSMETGTSSWGATVPVVPGALCPALTPDSETLVAKNSTHQVVPKNADMAGTMTHAGFDLMPVTSTLVSYEKDGVSATDGNLTVTGSDFSSPNTVKALVLDGGVDVEVEVRAGDLSETHTYTATITGTSSKEARVYATDGDQMYDVSWITPSQTWCARCVGHESFDIVITGDLLCKILDTCGCVGDGFDINILSAAIDTSMIPPHIRGLHTVSSPLVSSSVGVSALSDPSSTHPSLSVRLEKGSAVGWDDGIIVSFNVTIDAELISEHQDPDGTYDTRSISIVVRVVDPWCWGSVEPTYATVCGCAPVY